MMHSGIGALSTILYDMGCLGMSISIGPIMRRGQYVLLLGLVLLLVHHIYMLL